MPLHVENRGSTARDYCMLERNALSHFKLAILLSLISSSILLRTGISKGDNSENNSGPTSIPIACVQLGAAITAICAGLWEYWATHKDFHRDRAFSGATKPHFVMMTVVAAVVFTTCIILLADENDL